MPLTEPMCEINGQFARLRVKMLLGELYQEFLLPQKQSLYVCSWAMGEQLIIISSKAFRHVSSTHFFPRGSLLRKDEIESLYHLYHHSTRVRLSYTCTSSVSLPFPLCPFWRGRVSRLVEILISLKNKIK